MSDSQQLPLSILDLSPIRDDGDAGQSFRHSLSLAQHGEALGFRRYWLAEHHGMPGIASAATSTLLAYIGAGTRSIRIGAGGVMLPNHSPLVIAEQFGTLESLYPGRIDLGLGRAPGSDQRTSRALRRDLASDADQFPQDVLELMDFMSPEPRQPVLAVPGRGLQVPVWILGSSTFGAQLAAHLGLPYAFASHFAPQQLMPALRIYRETFKPSAQLAKPYAMAGFNIFAADDEAQAHLLASSWQQSFVNVRSGRPGRLPPPVAGYRERIGPSENMLLDSVLSCAAIGTKETVRAGLQDFMDRTGVQEVIVASGIYDHAARLRSYEIAAEAARELRLPA
ncbi:MAG: LLM class flavin-dependent oxidoreductase [Pseudacidovorax sp.]|uniref:LLM class flavin-dependent oxidoreductase n=1 Tax=Pseudacidovorax sp. TaxID=1934311 RepID=UPI001B6EF2E8|nr:LLM class flavin-dependent oxidoreductase [Pseudacidovorax sp.]MBP6893489.1 LLM class flavin-dependent oxidoreductase [Pseudacidovorax sp.]